jgi:hypothetical protein
VYAFRVLTLGALLAMVTSGLVVTSGLLLAFGAPISGKL